MTSVVGAFYYLRIIKVMYFEDAEEGLDKNPGKELASVMGIALIVVVMFFILPSPLIGWAEGAAASLFAG